MRIATARLEDVEVVVRVERGCAEAPQWPEVAYQGLLEDEGACLLVAWVDGEVVGFAAGRVVADVGELESVAVRASARRGGVGRALCSAVAAWARERGAGRVELEVRSSSAGAIALYAGLGFVEVGRRRGYYAEPLEDAVLMTLSLYDEV